MAKHKKKKHLKQSWDKKIGAYLAAHPEAALPALRTDPILAADSIRTMLQMDAAAAPIRETSPYPVLGPFGGISTTQPLQQTLPKQTPVNIRRFTEIPPARRAMCAIMDPIIDLPWTIELRKPIGNKAHMTQQEPNAEEQHRIEDVTMMLVAPNNDMSWRNFLRMVLEDLLTFGAGPFEIQKNTSDQRPFFLWPVDAQSVRVNAGWKEGSDNFRYSQGRGYYYGSMGTPDLIKLRDDELCYMKLNPRSSTPFGYGYAEVAFSTINAFVGGFDYAERRASNNTPNFGIFLGENVTVDQARQWQHYWINEIEGMGKVPILGGGKQPQVFNMTGTGEDNLFLRWQEHCIRIIAMSFGVSAFKLALERDVNRSCYSEDTETLTADGWKVLDDLSVDDLVASYNQESGEVEYVQPDYMHVSDYTGDMIHFHGKNVDILVTPDHRMYSRIDDNSKLGSSADNSQYEIRTAEDLENSSSSYVFRTSLNHRGKDQEYFTLPGCRVFGGTKGDYPDRKIPMDVWVRFLGYWLSEGHAKRYGKGTWKVNLCQHEDSLWAKDIEEIVREMPVDFAPNHSKADHCQRWQVADKALCSWLMAECGQGSHHKRIPDFVWGLSRIQLNLLFQALMSGDGTRDRRSGRKSGIYYTASKELADDVQLLAMMLGHRAQIGGIVAGVYRVSIVEHSSEISISPSKRNRGECHIRRVYYSGKVYCFSVSPHHLFLTRRNGKVAIQGNTATASQENDWMTVAPVANIIRDYLTYWLLWKRLGYEDLEFVWQIRTSDELKQAEILAEQYNMNAITVDEIRLVYERPPLDDGQGDLTKTAYEESIKASLQPETLPGSTGGESGGLPSDQKYPKGTPFDAEWSNDRISPAEREFLKALKRAKRHERYGIHAVAT